MKANRAFDIYSEYGTRELIKRASDKVLTELSKLYYINKGSKTFTINNTSGLFDVSEDILLNKTNKIFRIEERQIKAVLSAVNDGDVFYDVGAHIGMFSCFVIQGLDNGTVVSFEPNPYNLRTLNSNIELNKKSGINTDIIEVALSDEYGRSHLTQPANEIADGLSFLSSDSDKNGVVVETAPADGLISDGKIQPPNVVKIDVEGAEPLVVDGMEKTLSREDCHTVFVEIHPPRDTNEKSSIKKFNSSIEKMEQKFKNLGFTVDFLDISRSEPFLVAEK